LPARSKKKATTLLKLQANKKMIQQQLFHENGKVADPIDKDGEFNKNQ